MVVGTDIAELLMKNSRELEAGGGGARPDSSQSGSLHDGSLSEGMGECTTIHFYRNDRFLTY